MLDNVSIESVDSLVEKLKLKKVALAVLPDSLIAPLVQRSLPNQLVNDEELSWWGDAIAKASSLRDVNGMDSHSAYLTELMRPIGVAVSSSMSIARNVANPVIAELTESFYVKMQDRTFTVREPNVVIDTLPEICRSSSFINLLDSFDGQIATRFNMQVGDLQNMFPSDVDDELLRKMVTTNIASVDKVLQKDLSRLTNKHLRNIYLSNFAPRLLHNENEADRHGVMRDVIVFLMANYMRQNYLDGSNGSTARLDEVTSSIRLFAVMAIKRAIKTRASMVRRDMLISRVERYSADDITIHVNGEVYLDNYLKKGGSPEVLIGAILRNDDNVSTQTLLESKEYYFSAYKQDRILRERRLGNEKSSVWYIVLARVMEDFINDENNSERLNYDFERRSAFHKATKTYLDKSLLREGQPIEEYMRRFACAVLFYDKPIERILDEIDSLVEADEELTPKEAATIVQLNLTVDQLMQHVTYTEV